MSVGPGRGVLKCHGRDELQLCSAAPHLTYQLLTPPAAWGTCRGEHSYCIACSMPTLDTSPLTVTAGVKKKVFLSIYNLCASSCCSHLNTSIHIHSFSSHLNTSSILIYSMHYV